jgi:hypothetical protein
MTGWGSRRGALSCGVLSRGATRSLPARLHAPREMHAPPLIAHALCPIPPPPPLSPRFTRHGSILPAPFAEFEWCANAPRPRYIRYKSLTSSKQQGTARFGAKEFQGLADGEYLFSIDTGAIPVGSGAESRSYCVSQRLRVGGGVVTSIVGRAHGSPLPPANSALSGGTGRERSLVGGGGSKAKGEDSSGESDSDDNDAEENPQYMFAVPVLEYDDLESTGEVKKVYAMVDRLSYLDWGLKTEDEVTGKRTQSQTTLNSRSLDWNGCIVHDGAMWGEAAHGLGNRGDKEEKTARTSEGYGEATCATAEKLVRLLAKLTTYLPAMGGWQGQWNLDEDATFLDIGSGYGKVVFHAKLNTGCRSAVGVECVRKRVEISNTVLEGLYGELDRARLADDLLKGVSFVAEDACRYEAFRYSHIYIFDRVFSEVTTRELAKVLQRSPFYIMVSSRKPQVWWGCGLSKVQPVGKIRFKTTGKEGMTLFIYINSHFIPGI